MKKDRPQRARVFAALAELGVGTVDGAGNIGVNVAAGAFNMQQNLLTLAVASDSSLAEANAGIIQSALFNRVEAQDTINTAVAGPVSGAGNIGVNIAAGVGHSLILE